MSATKQNGEGSESSMQGLQEKLEDRRLSQGGT